MEDEHLFRVLDALDEIAKETGMAIPHLSRGYYELATDVDPRHRLATAFAELAPAN